MEFGTPHYQALIQDLASRVYANHKALSKVEVKQEILKTIQPMVQTRASDEGGSADSAIGAAPPAIEITIYGEDHKNPNDKSRANRALHKLESDATPSDLVIIERDGKDWQYQPGHAQYALETDMLSDGRHDYSQAFSKTQRSYVVAGYLTAKLLDDPGLKTVTLFFGENHSDEIKHCVQDYLQALGQNELLQRLQWKQHHPLPSTHHAPLVQQFKARDPMEQIRFRWDQAGIKAPSEKKEIERQILEIKNSYETSMQELSSRVADALEGYQTSGRELPDLATVVYEAAEALWAERHPSPPSSPSPQRDM